MADSVDRVFVHALNTVKKIPKTGAARPPPGDRMRLYGLYKQAMEGDVDGVMERPNNYSGLSVDELRREQDKWDAWNAQRGLGRTEAKRRYIESLIETMHTYATTPTANELVAELEFVWNQIKDNHSPSSSGSFRKDTLYGMPMSPRQDEYYDTRDYIDRDQRERDRERKREHDLENERQHRRPSLAATASDGGPMKILSPMSEEDEAERENRMRMIEEELEAAASDDDDEEEEEDDEDDAAARRRRRGITTVHNGSQYGSGSRGGSRRSGGGAAAAAAGAATEGAAGDVAKRGSQRWSKMMERAMVKLSAEIAALREQITSGREFRARSEKRPVVWFGWLAWALFKHITIDFVVLALVLLWMRRRKDRRLEDHVRGALRVLREYIRKILPSR